MEKYDIQELYIGRLILIEKIQYFGYDSEKYRYQILKISLFKKENNSYSSKYLDLLTGITYDSEEKFFEVGNVLFNSKKKIGLEGYFLKNNIEYKKNMTLNEILCALGFEPKNEEKEEIKEDKKVSFSKYQRKRK